MTDMPLRVLVPLAEGAEEMETVIIVDVLRRAGMDVTLAGLAGSVAVRCSRGVMLQPDTSLETATADGATYDLIVLPGGAGGANALAESPAVQQLLRDQAAADRWIGAICAAPIALVSAGVGGGGPITSHPSVRDRVAPHGQYTDDRVARHGRLITSRGPGTAIEFALALIGALQGAEAARTIADPMIVQ